MTYAKLGDIGIPNEKQNNALSVRKDIMVTFTPMRSRHVVVRTAVENIPPSPNLPEVSRVQGLGTYIVLAHSSTTNLYNSGTSTQGVVINHTNAPTQQLRDALQL